MKKLLCMIWVGFTSLVPCNATLCVSNVDAWSSLLRSTHVFYGKLENIGKVKTLAFGNEKKTVANISQLTTLKGKAVGNSVEIQVYGESDRSWSVFVGREIIVFCFSTAPDGIKAFYATPGAIFPKEKLLYVNFLIDRERFLDEMAQKNLSAQQPGESMVSCILDTIAGVENPETLEMRKILHSVIRDPNIQKITEAERILQNDPRDLRPALIKFLNDDRNVGWQYDLTINNREASHGEAHYPPNEKLADLLLRVLYARNGKRNYWGSETALGTPEGHAQVARAWRVTYSERKLLWEETHTSPSLNY